VVKKILILLRILWTAGAQRIAINEYNWLKKLGYEPELVFLRKGNTKGYEEMLKDINYKVVREGNGILTPLFYAGTKLFARDRGIESTVDLDLIMKVPEIAKMEGADYLICHDQFAGIGGLKAKEKYNIPYSVFIHEKVVTISFPFLGKFVNDLERKVLTKASKVFAVTEKVKETIYQKHGITAEVNYPGMDKISEAPYSKKENLLISVSFWDFGRRPWDYVELMKNVEDYKLLMVGNWRLRSAKENFLEKLKEEKMDDKVILKEGVSESELHSLYEKSKFGIRFGYGEYGPSMLTIEAIQHTLPLIINDELGTAKMIKENGAGYVVHEINYSEIKEFLNKIDQNKYQDLQRNIKNLQQKYSWLNHAKKLVDV